MCNRGPSTYKEALACERGDYRQLNAFDNALASALLYIIGGARKRRLPELVELIWGLQVVDFLLVRRLNFRLQIRSKFYGVYGYFVICPIFFLKFLNVAAMIRKV